MVILWGWVFLMSEVPLQNMLATSFRGPNPTLERERAQRGTCIRPHRLGWDVHLPK